MIAFPLPQMLLLAATMASPAGADEPPAAAAVTAYELRVDPRADGSADVALTLRLEAGSSQTVRVPFPWPELTGARLATAPPSTTFALTSSGDRGTLSVGVPDATPGSIEVRLEGRVANVVTDAGPAGRSIRVAMMNVEPAAIRDLRFLVAFPEGWRAHAIREALPKPGKAEVGPRAILESIDGRPGVRLRADALAQGDTAVLRVDLAPASQSRGWLIAGLVLAVLYLRSFRDLVGPKLKQKDPP